jgi:hypothetical protein
MIDSDIDLNQQRHKGQGAAIAANVAKLPEVLRRKLVRLRCSVAQAGLGERMSRPTYRASEVAEWWAPLNAISLAVVHGSSSLRSVKLAPAVRIDRVGHDFARGWRHKLNAGRALLVVFWGILIFG